MKLLIFWVVFGCAFAVGVKAQPNVFDVTNYDAAIAPDLFDKSVTGKVLVRFNYLTENLTEITLNAGSLEIDSVQEKLQKLEFEKQESSFKRELNSADFAFTNVMKYKFWTKSALLGLFILTALNCQSRMIPKSDEKTNVPVNNANDANQTKSAKIPAPQTVKFTSAGNVEIIGTFYKSPKVNSPAVLLLHQFGINRKSYDEFAEQLQKKGFGVLAIDGRGFGESTKTTDGKTVTAERTAEGVKGMEADVSNAFDFLAKQKNVDAGRIGIVGASYDSSLAIIYAAQNPKVRAVALLSPGINYFDNLPTEPAIKSYGDRPLLMAAAEDDKESADAVRKLKETGANEKYETKIYDKGGHGTALFAVGLPDALEQFLTKNL